MRKQKIQDAAFEVATQVRAVEECIDAALAEIAELQGKILTARAVSGTGVATAQPAFEQIAASISALVSARGGIARCHAELAEAKKRVPGLRETAWGDGDECPPPEGRYDRPDLRVVA